VRAKPLKRSTSLARTVRLHATFTFELPRWASYAKASAAAQAEWDKMFARLQDHELGHLEIARDEANKVAESLLMQPISEIDRLVTEANDHIRRRQDELDAATNHGAKEGVPLGGVVLDTSVR
jgi:predicted secreted Zn-dependent protease